MEINEQQLKQAITNVMQNTLENLAFSLQEHAKANQELVGREERTIEVGSGYAAAIVDVQELLAKLIVKLGGGVDAKNN